MSGPNRHPHRGGSQHHRSKTSGPKYHPRGQDGLWSNRHRRDRLVASDPVSYHRNHGGPRRNAQRQDRFNACNPYRTPSHFTPPPQHQSMIQDRQPVQTVSQNSATNSDSTTSSRYAPTPRHQSSIQDHQPIEAVTQNSGNKSKSTSRIRLSLCRGNPEFGGLTPHASERPSVAVATHHLT
jgi:hypothetical protein